MTNHCPKSNYGRLSYQSCCWLLTKLNIAPLFKHIFVGIKNRNKTKKLVIVKRSWTDGRACGDKVMLLPPIFCFPHKFL